MAMNKFCFCCDTRTGTLVIGTLGWILTLAQLFAGGKQEANEETTGEEQRGTFSDLQSFHDNIYFRVGWGLVTLLVCIKLVVGVYKKDRRFILPWLVLYGLNATIFSILTVIMFVVASMNALGALFLAFFLMVLITALLWYFWLCVFSHYKELGEPAPNGFVYKTENTDPPPYVEKDYNMA